MTDRNALCRCSIIACVVLLEVQCLGADYHVDAAGGNNDNDGLSPAAAWKTIAKVNASSFAPGDRILLKRGQLWREQLIVPSSGVAGQPIIYSAYGTGERPLLKGSALVQNWTGAGGENTWRAVLSTQPNQVFFDGVRGTLQNAVQDLDQPREWCWSSGVLHVYAASDPDGLYSTPGIEASVKPSTRTHGLLHVQNREYVTVESIAVTQSYSFGIYIKPASRYITVSDCEVSHSLDGGIVVPNAGGAAASQVTLLNCLVHHNNGGFKEGAPGVTTYHEGITMEYIDGFTIRGCHVYHNYMEGLNVKRGGRNGVIEYCTLYANDIINIYHEGASDIEIRYNKIYDCTYNAGIEFGLETNTYGNDNIRIHHNLFWGNASGVSFWAAGGITAQTRNISICNNTFYNNGEAIRWKSGATDNYSGANAIKNNLFWQNDAWNSAIKDYTTGRQGVSGTSIDYNVFQQGAGGDTLGAHAFAVTDPYFVNASGNDLHLRSGSPCIDAGTNVGLLQDYDGNTIPQGAAPDIGAYEYVDDEGTNSDQRDATLGVDHHSYPYIVRTDSEGANPQVYYCGVTYADPVPVSQQEITVTAGGNDPVAAKRHKPALQLVLGLEHHPPIEAMRPDLRVPRITRPDRVSPGESASNGGDVHNHHQRIYAILSDILPLRTVYLGQPNASSIIRQTR